MGAIKAILFDFGFTLCTMHDVSMEKYMEIYRKGMNECVSCLIDEIVSCDEEQAEILNGTIMELRRSAWRKSREDFIEYSTSNLMEQALKQVYKRDFQPDLINRLSDLYHSEELKHWVPFEGTIPTLKALTKKKYRLGVLSNHPHHPFILDIFKKHNLSHFFHAIHSSAEIGIRKPSKEVFKHVLNSLEYGDQPESCVMIGDEPLSDIHGGHNAGMKTVLMKREYKFPVETKIEIEPDAIIDKISDLPSLLEKWEQ